MALKGCCLVMTISKCFPLCSTPIFFSTFLDSNLVFSDHDLVWPKKRDQFLPQFYDHKIGALYNCFFTWACCKINESNVQRSNLCMTSLGLKQFSDCGNSNQNSSQQNYYWRSISWPMHSVSPQTPSGSQSL